MKGYKGLIDHLAFVYGYVCKARGTVLQVELADDPLRGDGEPVPKLVTGEAFRSK